MTDTLHEAEARLEALEADSRLVETGPEGRRIAWRIWGEGRPVVFFHGASGSWRHWIRQVETFRGRGRLIMADLPGFGRSDMPELPLDFTDMSREVAASLDEVIGADSSYDLAAFSYGGSVTSEFLHLHKGRQRRILLCAPAGFGTPGRPPMLKVRGLEGPELLEAHRANLESIMIAEPARIDALALSIQMRNSAESRLRLNGVTRPSDLTRGLADFDGPVTLIWGSRDAFMPEGGARRRMAQIEAARPDADLHLIDGAGHWVAYEAADRVNDILGRALFDS